MKLLNFVHWEHLLGLLNKHYGILTILPIDIMRDNRVQLFYSHTNNYDYLSIFGSAELINDKKKSKNYGRRWQKHGSRTEKKIQLSN